MDLRASIEVPEVAGHPNRLPFEGVLTLVDAPSDEAPSGARGHRVILTRAAALAALPSLLGMAIDTKSGWEGHDPRQKIGLITSAHLRGDRVLVAGYVWVRDFPELHGRAAEELGMSYELADVHVADLRQPIWTMIRATFTGAAVLLRKRAAYKQTSFKLLHPAETTETA